MDHIRNGLDWRLGSNSASTQEIDMTILVTGSTGTIGSQVAAQLAQRGAEVHALTRNPDQAKLPSGVTPVKGDFLDVDSMRSALSTARTLFLINPVVPDELTQAMIALNLARARGRHTEDRLPLRHA
jgi:uncharacterized protein YbjT (DUF2867 family)